MLIDCLRYLSWQPGIWRTKYLVVVLTALIQRSHVVSRVRTLPCSGSTMYAHPRALPMSLYNFNQCVSDY